MKLLCASCLAVVVVCSSSVGSAQEWPQLAADSWMPATYEHSPHSVPEGPHGYYAPPPEWPGPGAMLHGPAMLEPPRISTSRSVFRKSMTLSTAGFAEVPWSPSIHLKVSAPAPP